jgi:hypothetical protein
VVKAITEQMIGMGPIATPDGVRRLSEDEAFTQPIGPMVTARPAAATHGRGRWMDMSMSTLYDGHHVNRTRKRKR